MATLSPNVGLRLSSGLDTDSRYNLLRLDTLLASGLYDASGNLTLRSSENILFRPANGNGGTVGFAQKITEFALNATTFSMNDDVAFSGAWQIPKANLDLSTLVASDVTDFTAQVSANTSVAANTSHRNDSSVHFTENSIQHQNITGAGTNTHAQIDTHISSVANPHAVTASQTGAYTTSEVDTLLSGKSSTGHTHTSSDITDFTAAVNSNSNVSTAFAHSSATGNPHGVTAAQTGADTSAEVDAKVTNHSNLTNVHGVGTVVGTTEVQGLTNKTINASLNTITNLTNAAISASAAIAGNKILPDFGTQDIQTSGALNLENGGYTTGLRAATSGQVANVLWELPPTDGANGQVIATNGSGELTWVSVLSSSLAENHMDIGASGSIRTAVDTSSSGHISASSVSALTIKNDVITNAMVNTSAGITFNKMAALTTDRALISNGSGVLTVSTTTSTELGHLSGVTSGIQSQLDNKQPLDADLTALAALSVTGMLARTAANTYVTRIITAGSAKLSVTNGDGVAANPSVDLGTVSTDDLIEGTNQFHTTERAQDAVGAALTDTATVDLTYNDGSNQITADVIPSGINHDNLSGVAANEHIDHSTIDVIAGTGMSGGGDLTASRTLNLDINSLTSANPATTDTVAIYDVDAAGVRKVTVENLRGNASRVDWITADGLSKVINHGFNTQDVDVIVFDKSNGETIYVEVFRTDADNITVTSSQAPGASGWRVLIKEI